MICVVIKGPSFKEAKSQIKKAITQGADLVEICIRFFSIKDQEKLILELKKLKNAFNIPMIFTLRGQSEPRDIELLEKLFTIEPDFIDIELELPQELFFKWSILFPKVRIICSHHVYNEELSFDDLEVIYQKMQKVPAYYYKIAIDILSICMAMRLLVFAKKKKDSKLIIVGMNELGTSSRIASAAFACPLSFSCLDQTLSSAAGQISIQEMKSTYFFDRIQSGFSLFGLIGDPVSSSVSEKTHNEILYKAGLPAIYLKFQVIKKELGEFLLLARQLQMKGLSVTMPLKESVISFLDEIDTEALKIGAVNTIVFQHEKACGFNTDGIGALEALEKKVLVKEKKILVIGAGGAARAVIYEALKRKAQVYVINRNFDKAKKLEIDLGCWALQHVDQPFDIIINATPSLEPLPLHQIPLKSVIMDLNVKVIQSHFLDACRAKACQIVYGHEMFLEQALLQFNLWHIFSREENSQVYAKILSYIKQLFSKSALANYSCV